MDPAEGHKVHAKLTLCRGCCPIGDLSGFGSLKIDIFFGKDQCLDQVTRVKKYLDSLPDHEANVRLTDSRRESGRVAGMLWLNHAANVVTSTCTESGSFMKPSRSRENPSSVARD
ncbi:hypothetical protein RRG08_033482 [Elysia crispata]|uniref:Uncharacterized protein n=1 Tax=Elysia crispata TaxID=231223 RepID=A0AAE1E4G9_9GAST|nr:hypothetical protein RRG08_033482 [Elysia crispata]